jgi:hypothetical protein
LQYLDSNITAVKLIEYEKKFAKAIESILQQLITRTGGKNRAQSNELDEPLFLYVNFFFNLGIGPFDAEQVKITLEQVQQACFYGTFSSLPLYLVTKSLYPSNSILIPPT